MSSYLNSAQCGSSCRYYNWRQDTTSDLYVFLLLNVGLIVLGAIVKSGVVDSMDGIPEQVAFAPARFWSNIYDVGPAQACI